MRRFGVKRDVAGAGLGEVRCPTVGVFDHQVAVDGHRCVLEQRLNDGQSQRQVRDEVIVHDVDMDPVDLTCCRYLVGQLCEVGGQDARGNLHTHADTPQPLTLHVQSRRRGLSRRAAQQSDVDRVGAVAVRPQLHVRPGTEVGH